MMSRCCSCFFGSVWLEKAVVMGIVGNGWCYEFAGFVRWQQQFVEGGPSSSRPRIFVDRHQ